MDVEEIAERVAVAGLEMRPALSEEAIAAWESERGVSLPADYRRFLLEIGDGGEGPPSYGIRPLGEAPSDYHGADRLDPSLPWPLVEGWMVEWEQPRPDELDSEDRLDHGYLVLGTDGCGLYWDLIVNGERAGEIWTEGDGGWQRYPGSSFSSWYGAWLEAGRPETMPVGWATPSPSNGNAD